MSDAWDQLGDVLQIEGQVWRARGIGRLSAEGAGKEEREAEEAAGRAVARQCDAEGCRFAKVVTPDAKRDAMPHLRKGHEVSQRQACCVLGADRSSVRYRSVRPDDADLRKAMEAVAVERRRFGHRRAHVMLERQGWRVNQKKLRGLYLEEKLQVRKRGGRKRALGTRRPMLVPEWPNNRWSLDFVSDAFADGRRFRVLAIVDDFCRECLTLVADTSLSGCRFTREFTAIMAGRGLSDNGTELTKKLRCSDDARRRGSSGTTLRPESRCRTLSWKI